MIIGSEVNGSIVMSAELSVTLSSALSARVRQFAQQQQEEIVAVVERLLNEALPASMAAEWLDLSEPDEAAEAEMQAYLALHPWLKEHYLGKHVAVYHGQVVDADEDFDALFDRINQAYPDQFVWMSKVGDEAIETFTVRSPRFTAQVG